MSIAIIDSQVDGEDKKQVVAELGNCFHAAVQAREIATRRHDKAPEEVFIATLLKNLGKFSFWTFARKIDKHSSDILSKLSKQPDYLCETTEKEALGFSLQELTSALNQEWKLSPLLEETLSKKANKDPRVASVTLAHEIAVTSHKGWNSQEMKSLVKRLSEVLYMPIDRVYEMVKKNAELATTTLRKLGAGHIAAAIKPTKKLNSEADSTTNVKSQGKTSRDNLISLKLDDQSSDSDSLDLNAKQSFPEANPALQLQILSDINQLIYNNPDINLMLEMVLEGLHHGVGMDRAIFALLSNNKKYIKTKYSVGWDRRKLGEQFHFQVNGKPGNVFDLAMKKKVAVSISTKQDNPIRKLVPDTLADIMGNSEALIMTASIGAQAIGIFYADRKPSKRTLDDICTSSFELFCQQANLGLLKLRSK